MNEKISRRIEEIILVMVIALNVLDAFRLLKGDLDLLQKITSWVALGYILYKASFTKIIFGARKHFADLAIIIAYFMFVMKDFTAYAIAVAEESYFFNRALNAMASNAAAIENFGIYAGGILLIAVSLYAVFKFEVKKPSFMDVLQEEGKRSGAYGLISRFFIILLILSGFFVAVFNLIEGWLVFLLDSPIIIIGIAAYLFVVMRHYEKFSAEHLIFKAGDFGDRLYKGFVSLFHYRRGIFLGVGGLLALHLFTDFGNFVVPYVFGVKDEMFLARLGAGHSPLLSLMMNDIGAVLLNNIFVFITYMLNIIAIVFFLLMPAFVWYKMFNKKELHINGALLGIICSSLAAFFLMPLFSIRSIPPAIMLKEGIAGADIMTRGITNASFLNKFLETHISVFIVVVISIITGIVVYLLTMDQKARKRAFIACVLVGFGFFGVYIWFFFASTFGYYVNAITSLIMSRYFFIALYMFIFMILMMIFYIAGYFMFLYEIIKEHILKEFV